MKEALYHLAMALFFRAILFFGLIWFFGVPSIREWVLLAVILSIALFQVISEKWINLSVIKNAKKQEFKQYLICAMAGAIIYAAYVWSGFLLSIYLSALGALLIFIAIVLLRVEFENGTTLTKKAIYAFTRTLMGVTVAYALLGQKENI